MAVVLGAAAGFSPRASAAAFRPASRPEAADSTYPSTPLTCPAMNRSGRERVCHVGVSTVGPLM